MRRYGVRPSSLGQVDQMPYEVTHFNHEPLPQIMRKHEMPGMAQLIVCLPCLTSRHARAVAAAAQRVQVCPLCVTFIFARL